MGLQLFAVADAPLRSANALSPIPFSFDNYFSVSIVLSNYITMFKINAICSIKQTKYRKFCPFEMYLARGDV